MNVSPVTTAVSRKMKSIVSSHLNQMRGAQEQECSTIYNLFNYLYESFAHHFRLKNWVQKDYKIVHLITAFDNSGHLSYLNYHCWRWLEHIECNIILGQSHNAHWVAVRNMLNWKSSKQKTIAGSATEADVSDDMFHDISWYIYWMDDHIHGSVDRYMHLNHDPLPPLVVRELLVHVVRKCCQILLYLSNIIIIAATTLDSTILCFLFSAYICIKIKLLLLLHPINRIYRFVNNYTIHKRNFLFDWDAIGLRLHARMH
ncbi:hypothetical protein ACJX0J_032763 [Zea mays]